MSLPLRRRAFVSSMFMRRHLFEPVQERKDDEVSWSSVAGRRKATKSKLATAPNKYGTKWSRIIVGFTRYNH